MNINLEYYKYFYYVAKCGSISGAAKLLCISQPAVSQALHTLEASLGGTLFLRTSKGVKLTPEGTVLFNYVNEAYEHIIAGEEAFMKLMNMDTGEIKIGASDMTLQFYLLPYLEAFHEKYPDIKINVSNGPTPETLKNLSDGKIDFGIVSTPFDTEDNISSKNVMELSTIFIAGSDYKKLSNKTQKLDILTTLPLICLESNTSTRRHIDDFLNANNVSIEPEFELATSDMIVQFALRNLGIGCVVSNFAKPFIDSGSLSVLKFKEKMPKRYIAIVTNQNNTISGAATKLLEML